MSGHGHAGVLHNAQVLDSTGCADGGVADRDALDRNLPQVMGRTAEDGLRFVIFQLQEVCVHPVLCVSDAAHNLLLNIVEGHIRWIEREVHLGVIGVEMVFKTVGFYGLAERSQADKEQLYRAPTLNPGAHPTEGHGAPSACSGW